MARVSKEPVEVQELARVIDRISFLYVQRCLVSRSNNAITCETERNVVHIPAALVGCILLGPGTNITHAGIGLLADSGTSIVWCGEHGVRMYASGQSLAKTSAWLERQAVAVTNQRSRLDVARRMYAMRFPGEDVSGLTMQQLRGREGARVRQLYRQFSADTGVAWTGRVYDPKAFDAGDPVNQALSAANSALYGVCHAVIVSLGMSPALGFVHSGNTRSLVYDMADLYKADTSIPVAFQVAAAAEGRSVSAAARHAMREAIVREKVLQRCAVDLKRLVSPDELHADDEGDVVYLWDEKLKRVSGGQNYGAP